VIVEDLLAYTSEKFNKSLSKSNEETEDVPKEVLFHNRQAFGDILTMTCAIRDFKKQFPDTRVGVNTTAMHIWDHNPHIDHTFRPGSLSANKATVKIGPGFLTNKSGLWDYHMANAFRMDIQNKMGLKLLKEKSDLIFGLLKKNMTGNRLLKVHIGYSFMVVNPDGLVSSIIRWQEVINISKR
jgi:hypothetical protein